MRRLLITGGTGYLGAELVRLALDSGEYDVVATYRTRPPAASTARFVPLDLHTPGAARELIQAQQPDVIIHTAYVQRGADLHAVTARGSGEVAEAAETVGARLVHLSSDALFDGERVGAYTEADAPSPVTEYGRAKAEAEQLVAAANPRALIARTSLIYGGATLSPHEQFVLDALDSTNDVTFFTDEIRNPVQVTDLAAALLELADADVRGVIHVAGAEALSRYDFAQRIAAVQGRDGASLRGGPSPQSGVRRPRNCAMSSALAQSLIRTRLRGVRDVWAAEGLSQR